MIRSLRLPLRTRSVIGLEEPLGEFHVLALLELLFFLFGGYTRIFLFLYKELGMFDVTRILESPFKLYQLAKETSVWLNLHKACDYLGPSILQQ